MGTTIQSAAESVPITEIMGLKQFGLGHISYWFSSISQLRKTSQRFLRRNLFKENKISVVLKGHLNFLVFQGLDRATTVGENGPGKTSVSSFHTNFQTNSKGSSVTTILLQFYSIWQGSKPMNYLPQWLKLIYVSERM